ncbi:MAG: glycosyltransferase family 4 protein [Hyphomicrobium sp.]|jgi:glycosyltransferase involved in cell wall biosynthesis
MFMYWGRRGALTRFSLDLANEVVGKLNGVTISVSRDSSSFDEFARLGRHVFPVSTFTTNLGAVLNAWTIPRLCSDLRRRLIEDQTRAVVDLMPHVWSPIIAPVVRSTGARYVPIIHDADPHPGDRTTAVKRWLDHAIDHADMVLTLSGAVSGRLEALGRIPRNKIVTLFHPDLNYGTTPAIRKPPQKGAPARLLFMGRIMDYKGLPLFLDAVELLKENGTNVEVGVFGEGQLDASAARLKALNAEVVNRWLSDDEIGAVLTRFDIMVLSHVEASQSGVAAAAFGAGLPVVATPVGGLIEQVLDGRSGVLAIRADAISLSEAIEDLALNPLLYGSICANIAATREERSMARFAKVCIANVLRSAD